jgi:hypothetical protein
MVWYESDSGLYPYIYTSTSDNHHNVIHNRAAHPTERHMISAAVENHEISNYYSIHNQITEK